MNLHQLYPQLIFFGFAAVLIFSAMMVVIARNPVRSALFLVLAFFASAGLWILLNVEFLGLILIVVYVGAVMTLFLFVVMTLNIKRETARAGFVRYLPYGAVVLVLLVALMVYIISPEHFGNVRNIVPVAQPENYSNVKALGMALYTDYVYPFELAGVLLLVAIVAAITLTAPKPRDKKYLTVDQQINIRPQDRMRLVNMKSEKKNP
jgi:NADH-quinone oxidoreductase subunit J